MELRKSWIGENDINIIKKREKTFHDAWNNKSLNFFTRPLSLKNLDRLITRPERRFQKNINKLTPKSENENPKPKDDKWSFQEDAVNIFLEKKAGILEMATGTGKTRTTFKILGKLLDQKKINKIIIQMQGTELIDQWTKELDEWRINRDELIKTLKQNQDAKELDLFLANFKNEEIDILFVSQSFLPDLLNKLNFEDLSKTIIIHDEIHNLPTENMISKIRGLQKKISYRLGLSATVNDAYDVTRDDRLFEEVGPIIFKFDIEQAIKRGILVEFDVEYIYYKLTETEKKDRKGWMVWREQQIKLKQISQQEIDERFSRGVSLIFKKAQNKIQLLDDYINNNKHTLEKCFIFAQEMDYGDLILNKLIKYMPEIKTHYDKHADKDNLVEFAKGNLKCIINCKKLNEGINMKSLSNIILVSSEGKRQLIQRLGRVLRIDEENNPDKRAFVLDFINDEQKENMDGADFRRYEELNKLTKIRKSN